MNTEILKLDSNNPEPEIIERAVKFLQKGKLVVFPTETVYGLAVDAFDKNGIDKIYKVKKRPRNRPLPIAIANKEKVEAIAKEITPAAYNLMDNFWPGPLTLILKLKRADILTGGDERIAIRVPKNKFAQDILEKFNAPVVLTSANLSGNQASHSADEVLKDLNGKVDLILDAGKTDIGRESTILDITSIPVNIIRQGAVTKQEIDKIVAIKTVLFVCTGNSCRSVIAKALLEKFTENRSDIKVLSAGTTPARTGATLSTINVLKEEGIDVSNHIPQRVTADMIKRSNFILVMEKRQEDDIIALVPEAVRRTYLLKEFTNLGGGLEVGDPIGGDLNIYKYCFADIKEAVKRLVELL